MSLNEHGWVVWKNRIPTLNRVQVDLRQLGPIIDPTINYCDSLDGTWNTLVSKGRELGSLFYNAAKLRPSVHDVAFHVSQFIPLNHPALIDVNFRIDAPYEDHYLFGWHQDYWFNGSSPNGIVCWIPITDLDEELGGVELIPSDRTNKRILKYCPNNGMRRSYADALLLDEDADVTNPIQPSLKAGDVLMFHFNVLHRSRPNRAKGRCRWTIQARFVDLTDPEFRAASYRPLTVTSQGKIASK